MVDFVFPQDGDYGDAADFSSWLDHAGLSGYVNYGFDVTVDWANNQFDLAKGKGFVRADSEQGARSGDTREGTVYEAFMEARSNIDFSTSSGVNYVWLTVNLGQGNDIDIFVTGNETAEPTQPGFKFLELDAARETIERVNHGQDLEPERLKFQGRLQDPASPQLGEAWFREDEGVHYVELPGGAEQVPVAREFTAESFEEETLRAYNGDKGSFSFDALSTDGNVGLRSSVSSGQHRVYTTDKPRIPQPGDTISVDVLIGSEYTDGRFFYCVNDNLSNNSVDGYHVFLSAQAESVGIQERKPTGSIDASASIDWRKVEDEFVTLTITWGQDGTHRLVVTDENDRELATVTLDNADNFKENLGFQFLIEQKGSGTAEIVYDNMRVTRPSDNLILDSQDTVQIGGQQTLFRGTVNTGPINAPQNDKGVHTDQAVNSAISAGSEVGYLFGINARDLLDVYAESDGSGGIQNERVYSNVPLGLRDTNRQTLSGDITLTTDDEQIQNIDPGGAARTVTLPAEENGLVFIIANRADAAEAISLNDDGGTTLATVNQDDVAYAVSDGTGWMIFSAAGGVS